MSDRSQMYIFGLRTNHGILPTMKIVFATGNHNKLKELEDILPQGLQLLGLHDIGIFEEIPEDQDTLEGNAIQKAEYVFNKTGLRCFADDTGLEVMALNGAPGVLSARYAGPAKEANANMAKLMSEMEDVEDRRAQFRTVIALVGPEGCQTFEGTVEGFIQSTSSGAHGFGYDPIFRPEGANISFAEMTMQEKNKLSHRARAFQKLLEHFEREI